jgi:purine operon repressor
MEKIRRNDRIVMITKYLLDHPGQLIPLSQFTQLLNSAKSSISEDLTLIKETFQTMKLGTVETQTGAAGGVLYTPNFSREQAIALVDQLCAMIRQPERILPGGFLYLTDLIGDPSLMQQVGLFFAQRFRNLKPDLIATVETKGIPIGLMTARELNVPLVIVRSDSRISEGTSIGINYISNSQRRLATMSLPKRAVKPGARVLFLDDFLRGGGTAKGILDLMQEFQAKCVGMGFLVSDSSSRKAIDAYTSLLTLDQVDYESKTLIIRPGDWVNESGILDLKYVDSAKD